MMIKKKSKVWKGKRGKWWRKRKIDEKILNKSWSSIMNSNLNLDKETTRQREYDAQIQSQTETHSENDYKVFTKYHSTRSHITTPLRSNSIWYLIDSLFEQYLNSFGWVEISSAIWPTNSSTTAVHSLCEHSVQYGGLAANDMTKTWSR